MRRPAAIAAVAGVLVFLAGCGIPGLGGFDGAAEPGVAGPAELAPIGPVVELGSGEALGVRWRYVTFESRMGSCTRVEVAGGLGGGTACGGELGTLPPGRAVAVSGMGSGTGMPTVIEGAAAGDVAAIMVETGDGGRFPATLMSLAPVARDGQVFVAFVPSDRAPRRVVALDAGGAEIGREDVPGP